MRTVIRPLVPRMEPGVYILRMCTPCSFLTTLLLALFLSSNIAAQDRSMNCYSGINISLNHTGSFRLTVDRLSGMSPLDTALVVELTGRNEPIIDCREAGTEVEFIIRDTVANLYCWGTILVEDKTPFEITCNDGSIPCIDGLNSLNPADFITVIDNCLDLTDLSVSFNDAPKIEFPQGSDTIAEVLRTWIVEDPKTGDRRTCDSKLYVLPFDVNDIQFPGDTTIYCGQDPYDENITGTTSPSKVALLENCGIAMDTSIMPIGVFNCGSKRKYKKTFVVHDWVTGSSRSHMQFIIVEDTTIATIIAPDQGNFFLEGCSPMLVIDPPTIINNCTDASDADIWVKVDTLIGYYSIGDTVPVDIGSHRLIYTGFNACIDFLVPDTLDFNIAAPNAPTLDCNNLDRAISMGDSSNIKVLLDSAFASVTVSSCIPYSFLGRKVNPVCATDGTSFSKSLEFCLAEVCEHILIELVARDSMGRYSDTCQVWIDVQERVLPTLTLNPNPSITIGSDSMIVLDRDVIIASVGDNSNGFTISMTGSGRGMTGSGLGMSGSGIPFLAGGVFQKFTCDDVGSYYVEVTVTDCSNNSVTDTTTLQVLGGSVCPVASPAYTGLVTAYGREAMEGVVISASNRIDTQVSISDINGQFDIENIVPDDNYDIALLYDNDWQTGVTANDLALLQDYFLGIQGLNEYQAFSADVNGSGDINTIDLVTARRIVLGHEVSFDDIHPWIFNRKLDIQEQEPLIQLSGSVLTRGGIAIAGMKRGDMDADAMEAAKTRSTEAIEIYVDERNPRKNVYRVDLGIPQSLKALQLSLDIDRNIEILNIDAHMDLDLTATDGQLDILYYKSISSDPLWIEITTTKHQKEIFAINQNINPLQWSQEGDVSSLRLQYHRMSNNSIGEGFQLAAFPNPTTDNVELQFSYNSLNLESNARLVLTDALGKSIYQRSISLQKNENFMSFNLPLPEQRGLYIATLWAGQEQRQVKIVKN